jgi:hypothetical protein
MPLIGFDSTSWRLCLLLSCLFIVCLAQLLMELIPDAGVSSPVWDAKDTYLFVSFKIKI